MKIIFPFIQARTERMIPEIAFVTTNGILAISGKSFFTANAVFIGARYTSPGFIRIFLCNFIKYFSRLVQSQWYFFLHLSHPSESSGGLVGNLQDGQDIG